jgi:hypothetical protein
MHYWDRPTRLIAWASVCALFALSWVTDRKRLWI